jgi:hypothetical protein
MKLGSWIVAAAIGGALLANSVAGAAVVTSFAFDEIAVGVNNSPTPTVGTGTASPLGMTNSFTSPASTAQADVLATTGSSNPSSANRAWRVRGGGTGSGNGWAAAAPQYSQGAEFLTSTAGYKDIVLTFDWSPTTQGVKHLQVQYTANGSAWTNIGPIQVGPATEAWVNNITIDMSAIAAVNNNPNFGVRLVSAYAPDGPNAGQYVNLAGNPINSTSGNWRLDTIAISGNLVPEPTGIALVGAGLAAFVAVRRRATNDRSLRSR